MKPMLAANAELNQIKYPIYASAKLDGVRALVMEKTVFGRSLKEVPNHSIQTMFGRKELEGLDGEIIVGDPWASDVYRTTVSVTNSHDKSAVAAGFYVFDFVDVSPKENFETRQIGVKLLVSQAKKAGLHVVHLNHVLVNNQKELLDYEEFKLGEGYEGLILRSPKGVYKYGRSTVNEAGMLKLKRFIDAEAEIVEVYEEFENQNEAKTNALGRTERSSAQAGLKAKGTAGGLSVKDCTTGVEFSIGTGLTAADRSWFWKNRRAVVGKTVKYKYFPHGVKDKPRHPVYLGPREEWDL